MQKVLLFSSFLLGILLTACQSKAPTASLRRTADEKRAVEHLAAARTAMVAQNFEAAKQQVLTMRKTCKLALDAREKGIVLMDSIELLSAQSELRRTDSLLLMARRAPEKTADTTALHKSFAEFCQKVKFYQRKLQHDLQHPQFHD